MKKTTSAEDIRRKNERLVFEQMPDWDPSARKIKMNPLMPGVPLPPKDTVITRTSPVDNYQYLARRERTGEEWRLKYNDLQNKYHWEKRKCQ